MWLVTMWTLAVALTLAWLTRKRSSKAGRWLPAGVALVALIPLMPASHAEQPRKPVTGYGCEGAMNYVDEKRNINSTMFPQFARVFLPPITHADDDGDFIFMPYDDGTGFVVSKDHGLTFQDARWVGDGVYAKDIKKITVVHQQAFIETKDGRLFMTSKPIGKYWGVEVVDTKNVLPHTTLHNLPEYQHLPKDMLNKSAFDETR
jgi:hypothetical protein